MGQFFANLRTDKLHPLKLGAGGAGIQCLHDTRANGGSAL